MNPGLFILYTVIFLLILSLAFSTIFLSLFFAVPKINELKELKILTKKASIGKHIFSGLFWITVYACTFSIIITINDETIVWAFITATVIAWLLSLKSTSKENYANNFSDLFRTQAQYINPKFIEFLNDDNKIPESKVEKQWQKFLEENINYFI